MDNNTIEPGIEEISLKQVLDAGLTEEEFDMIMYIGYESLDAYILEKEKYAPKQNKKLL